MRYVVLVMALVGGVGSGLLGWYWYQELGTISGQRGLDVARLILSKEQDQKVREALGSRYEVRFEQSKQLLRIEKATYLLLIVFPLAIVGGLLAANRFGLVAGGLLILCSGAPAFFTLQSLEDVEIIKQIGGIAAPGLLLLAGGLSFFIRRGPTEVIEWDELDELPVRKEPAKSSQVLAAPTPVRPSGPLTVRVACPKCQTPLKITNPEAGKRIQCPRDRAIFAVTPEAIARAVARRVAEEEAARAVAVAIDVDEAEILYAEAEELAPRPVKKKGKNQNSMAAVIAGWVLLVGGAAAFSALTLMGKLTLLQ